MSALFRHASTLYKSDLTALTELGMSKKEAGSTLKRLHMRAVRLFTISSKVGDT